MKWGGNMEHLKSLCMYNFKKEKRAYISFGIIIMMTAIMLNLALVLVFQVGKAYDKKFNQLNTATINISIPKIQDTNTLMGEIEELKGVLKVECREAVFTEATVEKFRNSDFSMNILFYNKEQPRNINKLEVQEERKLQTEKKLKEELLYIPLYVAKFGEFELGDKIVYVIDNKKHTFLISGILEEMQYGNYGGDLMGAYLSENSYKELASEYSEKLVREYSIIVTDSADIQALNTEVTGLLKERNISILTKCDKDSTKEVRTMVCNLLILILSMFVLAILLVNVLLCRFRISNNIEQDIVNMGVLKALGYTNNMIIESIVIPYLIVTIIAALVGILASYAVLPYISAMLALQSGFSFVLVFDIRACLCVVIILLSTVAAFAYIGARCIRKLRPIDAIRGNSPRKNRKNMVLFGISFALTILVAYASTLFYNVIIKPDNFISTLSEETPEIIIYPKEQKQQILIDKLQHDSRVVNVFPYTIGNVTIEDMPVNALVCEDFTQVSNNLCYRGENPSTHNEIALGSIFESRYEIGEKIKIQNGDTFCIYEVTGFIQSVNYQGNVCEVSMKGYKLLNPQIKNPALYLYLKNGMDVEYYIDNIEEHYGDMIVQQINYKKNVKTMQEMYSVITSLVITVLFILMIFITLFTLYMVIQSLLVQRRKELGIYKAIGYSNHQLMVQIIGGVLPITICAVFLSSCLGLSYVRNINQVIFQSIGAIRNNMEVSPVFLALFGIIQIIVNAVLCIWLTKPIKKISAYALIKED